MKDKMIDMKKLAEKGNVCAQHLYGTFSYSGAHTPKNKKQSLKWLRASKDSHPGSAFGLAEFHERGECGLEKSDEIAMNLLKISADAGYREAQEQYAQRMWWKGMNDGKERVDAGRYASIAFSKEGLDSYMKSSRQKINSAPWVLGSLIQYGEGGMKQSLYLAKHYLQIAADGGDPTAYFQLAEVLVKVANLVYDDNLFIPGYSPIPKALYWARKVLAETDLQIQNASGEKSTRMFIDQLETAVKSRCANCNRGNKETLLVKIIVPLSCCVR